MTLRQIGVPLAALILFVPILGMACLGQRLAQLQNGLAIGHLAGLLEIPGPVPRIRLGHALAHGCGPVVVGGLRRLPRHGHGPVAHHARCALPAARRLQRDPQSHRGAHHRPDVRGPARHEHNPDRVPDLLLPHRRVGFSIGLSTLGAGIPRHPRLPRRVQVYDLSGKSRCPKRCPSSSAR